MNKKMKCLIVDDEKYFLLYIKTLFEFNGFDVVTKSNVDDALDVLKTEKVDFVISDLQMPGKDGYCLIEEISKKQQTKDIPIIIVSNDDSKEAVSRVMGMAVAGFIRKPFLKKHIEKIIEFLSIKGQNNSDK
jgi:DNA-binding response OmpR family regulator